MGWPVIGCSHADSLIALQHPLQFVVVVVAIVAVAFIIVVVVVVFAFVGIVAVSVAIVVVVAIAPWRSSSWHSRRHHRSHHAQLVIVVVIVVATAATASSVFMSSSWPPWQWPSPQPVLSPLLRRCVVIATIIDVIVGQWRLHLAPFLWQSHTIPQSSAATVVHRGSMEMRSLSEHIRRP